MGKYFMFCILAVIINAVPTVYKDPVFNVTITEGVVYGHGMYCNSKNFTQKQCKVVELTLDMFRPAFNSSTKVPIPTEPMPTILGFHGGSYETGNSHTEWEHMYYWARRGWVALAINYRMCGFHQGARWNEDEVGRSLVCLEYGTFPAHGPYGNSSCDLNHQFGKKDCFGLFTSNGCPLSMPPKLNPGSSFGTLLSWMYPAMRDAKAAVRWVRGNAQKQQFDPDYISAIGQSAGACSVVGLATSFEDDYKNEMSVEEDPTLKTTFLNEKSNIATALVQWGGDFIPIFTQLRDPKSRTRYTKDAAPMATYHGDHDYTIRLAQEATMKAGYEAAGVPYQQTILPGAGHSADDVPIVLPNGKNQSQHDNMFLYMAKIQKLHVL